MSYEITEAQAQVLIKAGKRTSVVCGADWKSLINFSYKFVKVDIPKLFEAADIQAILDLGFAELNVEPKNKPTEAELMSFQLWIRDELESISNLEAEFLSSPPKPEYIAAGINIFDKYGILNVVISISKNYSVPFAKIWKMKYSEVFDLQMYAKDEAEFNERLMKQKK
jgi:hypothetical protein